MLKGQLLSNWYPMRWIMLILGIVLGYNYLVHGAAFSGLLSILILFQAITNTGCVLGRCTPDIPQYSNPDASPEDVTFEEIKN